MKSNYICASLLTIALILELVFIMMLLDIIHMSVEEAMLVRSTDISNCWLAISPQQSCSFSSDIDYTNEHNLVYIYHQLDYTHCTDRRPLVIYTDVYILNFINLGFIFLYSFCLMYQ